MLDIIASIEAQLAQLKALAMRMYNDPPTSPATPTADPAADPAPDVCPAPEAPVEDDGSAANEPVPEDDAADDTKTDC